MDKSIFEKPYNELTPEERKVVMDGLLDYIESQHPDLSKMSEEELMAWYAEHKLERPEWLEDLEVWSQDT